MNVTQDITKIIIYFIIIFGVHIMIESYNKGIGYIMKSFEFALIEYESNLDLDTQNLIK